MISKYLKTSDMAKFLGLSKSWLYKNRYNFQKGKHYFEKSNLLLWNVEEMEKWLIDETPISNKASEVLNNILS